MTKILGIDPGSRLTGYGIIEVDCNTSVAINKKPRYLASGRIRLESESMPERLAQLFDSLKSLFADYQPDEVAIEQVFFGKNASSALKLGQARGVAMLVPALHAVPLSEYSPRSIKQTVTGSGAADKKQVQDMIMMLLNLQSRPAVDASDALAIALCHAQHRQFVSHSEQAQQGMVKL
jgi:crossover junction endodeoxyribonuclease RuvC